MQPADKTNRPAQASGSLWWLHPFWIVAVPLTVIALVAYLPEPDYRESWRTAKAFNASDLMLCLAVATAFSAGCLLAALAESRETSAGWAPTAGPCPFDLK